MQGVCRPLLDQYGTHFTETSLFGVVASQIVLCADEKSKAPLQLFIRKKQFAVYCVRPFAVR